MYRDWIRYDFRKAHIEVPSPFLRISRAACGRQLNKDRIVRERTECIPENACKDCRRLLSEVDE